jgi:hypothetical protein
MSFKSLVSAALLVCAAHFAIAAPRLIITVGAAGEDTFGAEFAEWSEDWARAAAKAGAEISIVGTKPGSTNDLADLTALLDAEPKEGTTQLWLVLLGHGTFAANEAKFNLRGSDLTSSDLAARLKPFSRPVAIVDCSSASGPFLNALAGPGRVVVTATRSGAEANYSRFGKFFAEAIGSPVGDLDKDGQVSLLEAFILASARTAEFYKSEGRLATEHSLLDDSGDGLGVQGDWFQGVRAVKRARNNAPVDGTLANQFVLLPSTDEQKWSDQFLSRRSQLEGEIENLRGAKATLKPQDYYARLEPIVHALARTYAEAEGHVTVLQPDSQGGLTLPASAAQIHGVKLRYEPQPHKNTLGYWTNPSDSASWTFMANRPGPYELAILQACGQGNGGSRVEFSVGEHRVEETVEETGAFTNFIQRSFGTNTLILAAGTNTLTVRVLSKPGGAVMDLREVRLKPVTPPPAPN